MAEAFPHSATAWPWPTFAVNVVAAFLLGYSVTRLQERLPLSSYRRPLLGTGVCGGLSTFSTMEVEILKMLSAHAYGLAAGYAAASIAAGYAALHLATALVRRARVFNRPAFDRPVFDRPLPGKPGPGKPGPGKPVPDKPVRR